MLLQTGTRIDLGLKLEAIAGNHSSTSRPLRTLSGAETVNLFQHANRHEVRPSPRNCPISIVLSSLALSYYYSKYFRSQQRSVKG